MCFFRMLLIYFNKDNFSLSSQHSLLPTLTLINHIFLHDCTALLSNDKIETDKSLDFNEIYNGFRKLIFWVHMQF